MKQTKQTKRLTPTKRARDATGATARAHAEADVDHIRALIGSLTGRQQTLADAIASNKQEAASALLNGDADASAELGAARRRMLTDADAVADAIIQAQHQLVEAEDALAAAVRADCLDDYAATKTRRMAAVQKVEHTTHAFGEALRELTDINGQLWALRDRLLAANTNAVYGTPLALDQQAWRIAAFASGNDLDAWFRHKIGADDRVASLAAIETEVHAEIDAQLGLVQ